MGKGVGALSDSALLDRLYAAIGTGAWQDFLAGLAGAYGGGLAALVLHDARLGQGFRLRPFGGGPRIRQELCRHYSRVNPWWQRALSLPVGAIVQTDALISPAEFRRTEFYNDWCRPQSIDLAIGVTLQRDQSRNLSCSVLLPRATLERDGDAVARLERIAPHLLRAAQLDAQLREARLRADAAEAAMAGLAMGMILADAKGRAHFLNPTAEAIVACGDGLLLAGGVLDAVVPSEGERLRGLVAAAIAGRVEPTAAPGGLMRVSRRSGATPYEVLVGPAPQSRLALGDGALLFVRDPIARPSATRDRLRALLRDHAGRGAAAGGAARRRHARRGRGAAQAQPRDIALPAPLAVPEDRRLLPARADPSLHRHAGRHRPPRSG